MGAYQVRMPFICENGRNGYQPLDQRSRAPI